MLENRSPVPVKSKSLLFSIFVKILQNC